MIGNFARLIRGGPPRVLDVSQDEAADAPPERFVEKVADEGGDVYVAPLLETLRAALRARRAQADPSTPAPEDATPDEPTEAAR